MTATSKFKLTGPQTAAIANTGQLGQVIGHARTIKALHGLRLITSDGFLTEGGEKVRKELLASPTRKTFELQIPTLVIDGLDDDEIDMIFQAVHLVVADQRQSYPKMADWEAVGHALGTLTLPGEGCVGGSELDGDESDPLFRAYKLILSGPKVVKQLMGLPA
jgi:hypothetical protein